MKATAAAEKDRAEQAVAQRYAATGGLKARARILGDASAAGLGVARIKTLARAIEDGQAQAVESARRAAAKQAAAAAAPAGDPHDQTPTAASRARRARRTKGAGAAP